MLVNTGPLHETKFSPPAVSFFEHVGPGDVRRHQVGGELDPLELGVENLGDRADDKRLGQPGHADQQAMAAREDRRQNLIDDGVLPDDHLVQFLDHQVVVPLESVEEVVEVAFFGRHGCEFPRVRSGNRRFADSRGQADKHQSSALRMLAGKVSGDQAVCRGWAAE